MPQTTRMELLRCANGGYSGKRCLGQLHEDADVLICRDCGVRYPIVEGVAVLKVGHAEETDGWFEAMYHGRSRYDDLAATDYLQAKRAVHGPLRGRA